ncbi:hypothetical protein KUCAC02_014567 [Chaenocephalus aceratus]|uniref:Uncharacterized protein n=1 Tax=Chaenocephalus aceratus TaxID=36190 RepID=A0ACB9WE88_CHAAC|nr:hypothetical protein KUCAC02_014567 [Chaenocephalus aceratus]
MRRSSLRSSSYLRHVIRAVRPASKLAYKLTQLKMIQKLYFLHFLEITVGDELKRTMAR